MGKKKKVDATPVASPLTVMDLGTDYSSPMETPVDTGLDNIVTDPAPSDNGVADGEKRPRKPRKPKEPADDGLPIIDGEMLLLLIDILVPMLISTAHNAVTDTRVSPDDLTLTEKQKTMMKTFADKVAERIRLNANPFLMLFAGLGGIYTMNYMNERNKAKTP